MLRVNKQDKTVTARHRETSDREVGQSESHLVMWWIVVEKSLPQVKTWLPPSGALWQESITEPANGRKQMNENVNFIVCTPTPQRLLANHSMAKVILKVNRLQRRIAKAVKEKHWGKAKALIHLLSKSFYAKLLAVFRVTNNKGGNTPGVDKIVWSNPDDKLNAAVKSQNKRVSDKTITQNLYPEKERKKTPIEHPA